MHQKLIINSKNMLLIIDDCLKKNNYYFDDKKNIKNVIEDFLIETGDKHPEVVLDYDFVDLNIHFFFFIILSIYRILDMIFDNIYKHSGASHVQVKVTEANGKLELIVKDNGKGLPEKYDEKSSWYSGIKRIREIVYLLDGEVMLTNDKGTTVKISIDINN